MANRSVLNNSEKKKQKTKGGTTRGGCEQILIAANSEEKMESSTKGGNWQGDNNRSVKSNTVGKVLLDGATKERKNSVILRTCIDLPDGVPTGGGLTIGKNHLEGERYSTCLLKERN